MIDFRTVPAQVRTTSTCSPRRDCTEQSREQGAGWINEPGLEQVLDLLEVRTGAIALCEIGDGWRLDCAAMPRTVVHFVVSGRGLIETDSGRLELSPGSILVVPRGVSKSLIGPGTPSRGADMPPLPLAGGVSTFRFGEGEPKLVLGCADIHAGVGDGGDIFEHLTEPMMDTAPGEAPALLFQAMLAELSSPGIGTRALAGALMKQIVILLLRGHVQRLGTGAPFALPMMHPQLGRALAAILTRPRDDHKVESLARLCGMSRSRFSHHFTATFGQSPMAFVQTARLRAGARLLRSTRMPVKTISANVGYASRSHFSRAFRAQFGIDPSAYRGEPEFAPAS
jgi:AraC-like DNA-binding protein/mannose-6-phosphate isomerase-like protein (cupin superfamily)